MVQLLTRFLFRLSPRALGLVALGLPFSVVVAAIVFFYVRVDHVVQLQTRETMRRVSELAAGGLVPKVLQRLQQADPDTERALRAKLEDLRLSWPEIAFVELWLREPDGRIVRIFNLAERDEPTPYLEVSAEGGWPGVPGAEWGLAETWVEDEPHAHGDEMYLKVVTPIRDGDVLLAWLSIDYRHQPLQANNAAVYRAALFAAIIGLVLCYAVSRLAESMRRMTLGAIEDRRRAADAMREARDAAEKARDAKTEFLAIAAHDLKNPLAAIQGYCQLAELAIDRREEDQTREKLDRIRGTAATLLHIVENLLATAALERTSISLEDEVVDWGEIVTESLRLNSFAAQRKTLALGWEEPAQPVHVRGDRMRLFEAVDNLVNNAVKYTPPGKSINLRLARQEAWARFEVIDEGPGLSPKDHQMVFGQFQRLSAEPTGGETSLGLGLSIVKAIVEAHGGRVGVSSIYGEGATFYIELPVSTEPVNPTASETVQVQAGLGETVGAVAGSNA